MEDAPPRRHGDVQVRRFAESSNPFGDTVSVFMAGEQVTRLAGAAEAGGQAATHLMRTTQVTSARTPFRRQDLDTSSNPQGQGTSLFEFREPTLAHREGDGSRTG